MPYRFALLAKNFVTISEGHGWMMHEGHMRNERRVMLYVVQDMQHNPINMKSKA